MDIETGVLAVLILGFLLGLKHATDADHVVAVSAIVTEQRNIWRGLWIGGSWGAGHSTPLLLVGLLVLVLKDYVLGQYEAIAPFLEFGVGIMLVYLGVSVVWNIRRGKVHMHQHVHENAPHVHIHATHEARSTHDSTSEGHSGFFAFGKPVFRLKSYVIGDSPRTGGQRGRHAGLAPDHRLVLDGRRLPVALQCRNYAVHGGCHRRLGRPVRRDRR